MRTAIPRVALLVALLVTLLLIALPAQTQNGTEDPGDGNTTEPPLQGDPPAIDRGTVSASVWIGLTAALALAAFLYGRDAGG